MISSATVVDGMRVGKVEGETRNERLEAGIKRQEARVKKQESVNRDMGITIYKARGNLTGMSNFGQRIMNIE